MSFRTTLDALFGSAWHVNHRSPAARSAIRSSA
jgi:hypothetical protein